MPPNDRSPTPPSYEHTTKFPDLPISANYLDTEQTQGQLSPVAEEFTNFSPPHATNGHWKEEPWHHRRERISFAGRGSTRKASRQKSLSEAFRTIRGRRASVSENAVEIADALKAPVSPMLVMLCGLWYMASIFSNASSKSILIGFRYPVTLTVVQFAFVSSWCVISSRLARRYPAIRAAIPTLKHPIRRPSKDIIFTTLPLTMFQIGGHILNSDAMARIPVSLVHTIKGLSPLFTVLAYRLVFRVHYSTPTYLSLVPLTLGVIMACSANVSGDFLGLLYAFGSAILFVTQNIVSKKLFNEAARAESQGPSTPQVPAKPDKLNLLCYSSGLALVFTLPIWVWSEGITLTRQFFNRGSIELAQKPGAMDHGRLALEFVFNGTFHYAQCLVAFMLLAMISPVTYSVASLIKRVFVITFAIVWFGSPMTKVQGFGIVLTFIGLYLYDRTNDAARADRRAVALQPRPDPPLLPLSNQLKSDETRYPAVFTASPVDFRGREWTRQAGPAHLVDADGSAVGENKREEGEGGRRRHSNPQSPGGGRWLAPGTKQEETWSPHDKKMIPNGNLI